jgi:uncharacterized protein RhaS with RHS repeats
MTPSVPDPFTRPAAPSLEQALARLGEAVRRGQGGRATQASGDRRLPFRRDIDG